MVFHSMLFLLCAVHGPPPGAFFGHASVVPWAPQALHPPVAPENHLPAPPHSHEKPSAHMPEVSSPKKEAASLSNLPEEAAQVAHQFLSHLLRKDWEAVLALAAFPFALEGQTYASAQALREAWEKQLSPKYLDNYELGGVEVLTFAQMKERFGPPPERLNKLLSGRHAHWFAVVNVSGRAVVLLLQPPSRHTPFRVVAFHD